MVARDLESRTALAALDPDTKPLLHHARSHALAASNSGPAGRERSGAVTTISLIACGGAAILLQGLEPLSAKSVVTAPASPAATVPAPVAERAADSGATAELLVTLQAGDTLEKLLNRAGVMRADAQRADSLVSQALARPAPAGTKVSIELGKGTKGAPGRLQRVALRTGMELSRVFHCCLPLRPAIAKSRLTHP